MSLFFITGIDTDAGKSYAAGMLYRYCRVSGIKAITQKLVQTGCKTTIAEDIITHRSFFKNELLPEDNNGLTSPQIFKFPASPHLAAELEQRQVELSAINESIKQLLQRYSQVIIEGVGGLSVPLHRNFLLADWLQQHRIPTVIVSSPRLGSINHTLLTLEVAAARNIPICGMIYNLHNSSNDRITADTRNLLRSYLEYFKFPPLLLDMPVINNPATPPIMDFSSIISTASTIRSAHGVNYAL